MANEGKFDRWGVLPWTDTDEGEFTVAFQNTNAKQGQPFMHTSEPMSEAEVRVELEKMGVSQADADAAIAKARASKANTKAE